MPTRNVVLTEQQEIFVGQLVETGRYQNTSEVLRNGLHLLEDRGKRSFTG
ncbi:type II toxin-antitoxin system ParD family antitoxin [Haliea sp. E1-2-M8]|nr:type II toxin-antitoxin system ParD family antitoxin [Haliea sp. E1-2-M8]MDO8864069.1 type II toxin-antitoxin system ParD family antitoxin [Haliea sp. E1-2-M8]